MIASIALSLNSSAEEKKTTPKAERNFHDTGLRIGFDITRPIQGLWNKGDRFGAEFSADMEAIPDLFITAEAGWEKFNMLQKHVDYTSNGTYLRIGADYNLLRTKGEIADKSTLYVGIRYGFSVSAQTINSYKIDNYWGVQSGSFDTQNYGSHWGEIVFGMKTEIFKNIYLGWSVRGKFLFSQKDLGMPPAYFSAGYGTNDNAVNLDFTYSIIYSIPFNFNKNKQQTQLPSSK